jgi:hypothetical protein
MLKSTELSIIVYSCWKNRDMWEIFSILFRKYWKDCPYKVVLATDKYNKTDKEYVFDNVVELDDTWARMIKNAIKAADTPYVMLWMDDYLLCDYISDIDIEQQLQRAKQYKAANMRLIESPKCKGIYKHDRRIGYYKLGEAYSLSTQVGIWDSKFLYDMVNDEWSAWDFERMASLTKIKSKQPVLVSLDYQFPYEEGVRKGKWMVAGFNLCRRNGIKLDTTVRPIMTNLEMANIYFLGFIMDLNPTLILKIQNKLEKVKNSIRSK